MGERRNKQRVPKNFFRNGALTAILKGNKNIGTERNLCSNLYGKRFFSSGNRNRGIKKNGERHGGADEVMPDPTTRTVTVNY